VLRTVHFYRNGREDVGEEEPIPKRHHLIQYKGTFGNLSSSPYLGQRDSIFLPSHEANVDTEVNQDYIHPKYACCKNYTPFRTDFSSKNSFYILIFGVQLLYYG
jgi:hypothetical protein